MKWSQQRTDFTGPTFDFCFVSQMPTIYSLSRAFVLNVPNAGSSVANNGNKSYAL